MLSCYFKSIYKPVYKHLSACLKVFEGLFISVCQLVNAVLFTNLKELTGCFEAVTGLNRDWLQPHRLSLSPHRAPDKPWLSRATDKDDAGFVSFRT